jgi:hypothetical protein
MLSKFHTLACLTMLLDEVCVSGCLLAVEAIPRHHYVGQSRAFELRFCSASLLLSSIIDGCEEVKMGRLVESSGQPTTDRRTTANGTAYSHVSL